ncbi:hypothetical protein NPIL_221941 [Nephila pilipes]|uniref:Spider venom protein n=1 Tax=Nephila pilipes TaxID=299642 RepID=A0A8X6P099_NEPPI|nr:hypothetical protein NPIL_221941 [Nephila pilipes]
MFFRISYNFFIIICYQQLTFAFLEYDYDFDTSESESHASYDDPFFDSTAESYSYISYIDIESDSSPSDLEMNYADYDYSVPHALYETDTMKRFNRKY